MPFSQRILAHRVCARFLGFALALSLLILAPTALAAASGATKTVTYHGYSLRVPRSWPVYDLAAHPSTCVRFNRHAVYLGTPSPNQSCPVTSIGRTEAILIGPSGAAGKAGLSGADVTRRVEHGVTAVATWNRSPAVIEHALGFGSLHTMNASEPATPAPAPSASAPSPGAASAHTLSAHAATANATAASVSTPGEIYTGKGFDVCSTPSSSTMSNWGSSPYRAIGVYIGGTNRACSQPNLTTSWVSQESDAGWHLIPIYVGLQAPSNSCGCASISSSSAASEGAGAANGAVADAQSVGIGPGNPLYFDMEGYSRTSSNSSAVLTFLQAWTEQLHADGYLSGVYSSGGSGIADLVSRWGTGYVEPDELWFADWNGSASTSDSYVPSSEWTNHQRLHQYSGGTNQTYGGSTLNIDQDYLSAATAAIGSGAAEASAAPTDLTTPTISGNAYAGQTLHERHGSWMGSPTAYSYQWYLCDSTGANCLPVAGANTQSYVVPSSAVGSTVRVTETATNAIGPSSPSSSPQTAAVLPAPISSYWLYTAYGNVYNALGAPFYGSAVRSRLKTISGMALTADSKGYWLVDTAGKVFHYGDATATSGVRPAHPIVGIVAAPGRGFYLITAYGNVYNLGGARFYGSPRHSHRRVSTITGMAVAPGGRGYWLVDSAGQVFHYGKAANITGIRSKYAVRGVGAAPGGGIWMWTSHGNVFNLGGAPFYGSPFHRVHTSSFRGFGLTANRGGYWLAESGGKSFAYGNAEPLPAIAPKHPIIGMAG